MSMGGLYAGVLIRTAAFLVMGDSGPRTGESIWKNSGLPFNGEQRSPSRERQRKNGGLPFNGGTAVPKPGGVHIEDDLEEQRPSI